MQVHSKVLTYSTTPLYVLLLYILFLSLAAHNFTRAPVFSR